MSNRITVHPMTVRGQVFAIQVDEQGRFVTQVGTEMVEAITRDGLKDKLMELTAKASAVIRIPFTLMTPGGPGKKDPARGVVTGIHGGNGNLLVEWITGWQAGQKTQWTPSYGDVVFAEVSQEDVEAWHKLRNLKQAADRDLFHFETDRKLDLKVAAAKAVQEAVNDARQA